MSQLSDIASELQAAEDALRARIEQLFGGVHTTDFAPEFAAMMDVHDKIMKFSGGAVAPATPAPQSPVPVTEKPAA